MMASFITLMMDKVTGQVAFIDRVGKMSKVAPKGVKLMVDRRNPFIPAATTTKYGSEVLKLDPGLLIPDARIHRQVLTNIRLS